MSPPDLALQVFIYNNVHDMYTWSTTNAAVVVVSYDKFTIKEAHAVLLQSCSDLVLLLKA